MTVMETDMDEHCTNLDVPLKGSIMPCVLEIATMLIQTSILEDQKCVEMEKTLTVMVGLIMKRQFVEKLLLLSNQYKDQ